MTFRLSKNTSDFIKIFAAIIVMIHHYSQYVCANDLSESVIYKAFSSQAGYLGVALFFFLSGFGLMESEQRSHLTASQFLKKRFLKIYLPVIVVTLLWMLASPFLLSESPFEGYHINLWNGKTLILGNILYSFGDGVLWFIKVLFFLYISFYIFSFIRQKNENLSIAFLVVAGAATTVSVAQLMGDYVSISIPYFFVGTILSLDKETKGMILALLLLCAITLAEFVCFKSLSLAVHNAIDVSILAVLIVICSTFTLEVKVPSILAAISFDIYLVHNKVLMAMKANTEVVELLPFVLLTIIATVGYYLLRTKILRI